MRLKDKVILVTASTRGIGLAIVKKCAEEGAKVYMAARNLNRAQEIAGALSGVKCVYNDATKPETFSSMVEEVVTDSGRIDVLVNNFGTSNPGKDLDFANTDSQIFLDTVNLNLRSVFMASQAAAKHMAGSGGGSIINISSVGGRQDRAVWFPWFGPDRLHPPPPREWPPARSRYPGQIRNTPPRHGPGPP